MSETKLPLDLRLVPDAAREVRVTPSEHPVRITVHDLCDEIERVRSLLNKTSARNRTLARELRRGNGGTADAAVLEAADDSHAGSSPASRTTGLRDQVARIIADDACEHGENCDAAEWHGDGADKILAVVATVQAQPEKGYTAEYAWHLCVGDDPKCIGCAAKLLQIVTEANESQQAHRDLHPRVRGILECLADDNWNPDDDAADGGISAFMVVRHDAAEVLREIGKP